MLARVRLVVPGDPLDDWELELQLADEIDAGRWCTAGDVWDETALATDLAKGTDRLSALGDVLLAAAGAAASAVPELATWAGDPTPRSVLLDVDTVESFLADGPEALERVGIGLIGPEQLIRAGVRVRGTTQSEVDPHVGTPGAFGREALVNWSFAVNDGAASHAVDDAQLARLEATGATLLHIGHRWVQIDAEAIRRAQQRMAGLRTGRTTIGAAALLELAARAAATDAGHDLEPEMQVGVTVNDIERVPLELATDRGWTRQLISGLGDEQLSETPEPAGFIGTLRPYQRRGLGWLQFLHELGLGGCLADDMGLGKTADHARPPLGAAGPAPGVCPLSVVRNWEAEAARFTPLMRVAVHHGTGPARRRRTFAERRRPPRPRHHHLSRRRTRHRDAAGRRVDDASCSTRRKPSRTRDTQPAKALRRLPAAQRIALTGTPVENRLSELWSIMSMVTPGLLGNLTQFRHRFADADRAQPRSPPQPRRCAR